MDIHEASLKPLQEPYYGKHLLFFPSRKNQRMIVCHSALEADYCVHLEYDTTVIRYESQPGPFQVDVGGRLWLYTPDFSIETLEDSYYTEVKIDFRALSTRAKCKLEAASRQFVREGSSLSYADLQSIRQDGLMRNLKFLYSHSFNVGADEYGACHRLLSGQCFPIKLGQLLANTVNVRERAIYLALFEGKIECNFTQRLSLETWLEMHSS